DRTAAGRAPTEPNPEALDEAAARLPACTRSASHTSNRSPRDVALLEVALDLIQGPFLGRTVSRTSCQFDRENLARPSQLYQPAQLGVVPHATFFGEPDRRAAARPASEVPGGVDLDPLRMKADEGWLSVVVQLPHSHPLAEAASAAAGAARIGDQLFALHQHRGAGLEHLHRGVCGRGGEQQS